MPPEGVPELAQHSSGVGINDPAIEKIPFVQDRIASVEEALASLDATTEEGLAREGMLNKQLQAPDRV